MITLANKGQSLMKWSENHPAGQLQREDKPGMLPLSVCVEQAQRAGSEFSCSAVAKCPVMIV